MIDTPTAVFDQTFDRDEDGRAALYCGVEGIPIPIQILWRDAAAVDRVGDAQPRAALEARLEPRLAGA